MDQIDWTPTLAAQSWNTLLRCVLNCCSDCLTASQPPCPLATATTAAWAGEDLSHRTL